MHRTLLLLFAAASAGHLALACAPAPPPPATVSLPPPPAPAAPAPTVEAAAPTASPDEAPPVMFNVDSAQAFDVLAAMENVGREPVLVDAAALASLRCAGITLHTPDRIPGPAAAELLAREFRALHYRVEHAAGRWVISVDAADPPAACAPPAPAPVAADEDTARAAGEVARSVRRVSDTEYVLKRAGLEAFLEHAPALLKGVRVVPEKEGDKLVGIRIFGVRAGDTAEHLGIQNGDRLERLGGYPLSDPQHALEAYAKVRKARRAVLEIVRHGVPMKIVYRVE